MHPLPCSVSVLIVGAGPVGLTVANLLGSMGVDVVVLDKNAQSLQIPRAIVLDDEGARALQAAGIINQILPSLVEGDGPMFYEDDGSVFARVGAGSKEYGFAKRYFIHQPDLEGFLKIGLARFSNTQLVFGAEVMSASVFADHVDLEVQYCGRRRRISAAVVLACDGARSSLREMLQIEMHGTTYRDEWLIVDTTNDPDQSRSAKYYCRLTRPFVSIPAPNGGRRYEFKLLPGESREEMMASASVERLLGPIRSVVAEDVTRVAVYGFQARMAQRMTEGRILLLGDAAHLTPPFAGQGMNAGLRDAVNVAWKVAMVVREQACAELLATYEQERRDAVWAMIQVAVTMGEIIMPKSEVDRQLRIGIFHKLSQHPAARDFIVGMKFKPRPRCAQGAFVGLSIPNVPGSLVGSMIPQPRVRRNGETPILLDEVLGADFSIIAQSRELGDFARSHRDQLWPELRPVIIEFLQESEPCSLPEQYSLIEDGGVAFPLRAHRDQLLLVRPDRYIATAFWPRELERVVEAFRLALKSSSSSGAASNPIEERRFRATSSALVQE